MEISSQRRNERSETNILAYRALYPQDPDIDMAAEIARRNCLVRPEGISTEFTLKIVYCSLCLKMSKTWKKC